MIVKNLTRSSSASIGQLFKYVFNPEKSKDHFVVQKDWSVNFNKNDYFWSAMRCGVRLSEQDLQYLHAEHVDAQIMLEYKRYGNGMTLGEYMIGKQVATQVTIKHGVTSKSIQGMVKEFQEAEEGRSRKSSRDVAVHHTVLAFDHLDAGKVSDTILLDLTRKYMELRGEALYAGTIHRDKHPHVHLIMSATFATRSTSISKQKLQEIKILLQNYQKEKYPALTSLPKHTIQGEKIKKIDRRQTDKISIQQCIETHTRNALSTKHFLELMQKDGYEAYYRNGRLTGITNEDGMKFRFSRFEIDLEALSRKDIRQQKEQLTLKELSEIRNGKNVNKEKHHKHIDSSSDSLSANDKQITRLKEFENTRSEKDSNKLTEKIDDIPSHSEERNDTIKEKTEAEDKGQSDQEVKDTEKDIQNDRQEYPER